MRLYKKDIKQSGHSNATHHRHAVSNTKRQNGKPSKYWQANKGSHQKQRYRGPTGSIKPPSEKLLLQNSFPIKLLLGRLLSQHLILQNIGKTSFTTFFHPQNSLRKTSFTKVVPTKLLKQGFLSQKLFHQYILAQNFLSQRFYLTKSFYKIFLSNMCLHKTWDRKFPNYDFSQQN